jgi:hypothetical protein
MARLKVTTFIIEDALFRDSSNGVNIVGASYEDGCVVFEIEGYLVPQADEVQAVLRKEAFTVAFNAIS